jgi:hypothetical protein
MSLNFYQAIQRHIPDYGILHSDHRANLKPHEEIINLGELNSRHLIAEMLELQSPEHGAGTRSSRQETEADVMLFTILFSKFLNAMYKTFKCI